MSRKNSKEKIKLKPFKVVKEVGFTEFSQPVEQTGGNPVFCTVGNFRSIENFIGVRLNTPTKTLSEYYMMYHADITTILQDYLSVAYIYVLPNRLDTTGIKCGTYRQSGSGRAIKVLFDSGRQIILNRASIEKSLKNISYVGGVIEANKHDKNNTNKTGQ